jgi:large subunit ribosomal protein L13
MVIFWIKQDIRPELNSLLRPGGSLIGNGRHQQQVSGNYFINCLLEKKIILLLRPLRGILFYCENLKKSLKLDAVSYKTVSANAKTVNKNWVVIDASNQVVGRLTSEVAKILRGKHKPSFTPHVDCGDYVIIINAEKVRFTGKKMSQKEYVHYTGYPGGQRFATPTEWMRKNPALIVENAVRGMLPKTKLGREVYRNLHVYVGAEHPHAAQKPKEIKFS